MDHLSHYFDTYANVAPQRKRYVSMTGHIQPGYSPTRFERIWHYEMPDENEHSALLKIVATECAFRNIEEPAVYIDRSGYTNLGVAHPIVYAIVIEQRVCDEMNQSELRALVAHEIKHLYQSPPRTPEESCLNEYDCDRAAVESSNYETIQSYVTKAAHIAVDKKLSSSLLRKFAHSALNMFPHLLPQLCYFKLDPYHPSPAARLKAMRNHEAKLLNKESHRSPVL